MSTMFRGYSTISVRLRGEPGEAAKSKDLDLFAQAGSFIVFT